MRPQFILSSKHSHILKYFWPLKCSHCEICSLWLGNLIDLSYWLNLKILVEISEYNLIKSQVVYTKILSAKQSYLAATQLRSPKALHLNSLICDVQLMNFLKTASFACADNLPEGHRAWSISLTLVDKHCPSAWLTFHRTASAIVEGLYLQTRCSLPFSRLVSN